MKKLFIIGFLFSLLCSEAGAQYRWEYGGGLGAANYLGEVGGGEGDRRDFIADLKLGFTRYQINGYSRYKISKDFSVKGNLIFVNISGNDNKSVNPTRVGRNLNFSTNIIEMSVQGEWNFYQQSRLSGRSGMMRGRKKKRTDFKSYLFAGIGFFYYNPKAEIEGKSYALRKYETEGVSYSPIGICYPIGLGFAYTINKTIRLSMDMLQVVPMAKKRPEVLMRKFQIPISFFHKMQLLLQAKNCQLLLTMDGTTTTMLV
jgi:hypothetical protein